MPLQLERTNCLSGVCRLFYVYVTNTLTGAYIHDSRSSHLLPCWLDCVAARGSRAGALIMISQPIPTITCHRAAIARLLAVAAALLLAVAAIQSLAPCGVPPGEQCGTDSECVCMHGGEF